MGAGARVLLVLGVLHAAFCYSPRQLSSVCSVHSEFAGDDAEMAAPRVRGTVLEKKLLDCLDIEAVDALAYRVEDGIAVLSLGDGDPDRANAWGTLAAEHRIEPHLVLALMGALDAIEHDESAQALVVTAEGKYWCNGFDLRWIHEHLQHADELQQAAELLLARILQFPKPTLAAVNGHACAAGAMLMLAMDFRVMNEDKGFVFVPGIDLGLAYTPGMSALMAAKLPQQLHRDFIIYGQRFTAKTLSPHGVVETAPAAEVLAQTLERARAVKGKSKHASTMARIKQTLYHEAVAALQHHPDCMFLRPTSNPMGFENLTFGCDRPTSLGSSRDGVSSPGMPRTSSPSSSAASSKDALTADIHMAARSERITGLQRVASLRGGPEAD